MVEGLEFNGLIRDVAPPGTAADAAGPGDTVAAAAAAGGAAVDDLTGFDCPTPRWSAGLARA